MKNFGVISKYRIVMGTPLFNRQNVTSSKERTNELNALMHKFSLDMLDIFLEHMPNILDSVQKELKLEADKRYKCSLQDDDYKNKECI